MRFKRLQSRILAYVLGIITLLSALTLISVQQTNLNNAQYHIFSDIRIADKIFNAAIADTTSQLFESAQMLSNDYAFKRAFGTRDHPTIVSAMQNQLSRLVQADLMLLLNIDNGIVIGNTLHPEQFGSAVPFQSLLKKAGASEYGEASDFISMDGVVYEVIVLPLFMPQPAAWIVFGFRIDHAYLERFHTLTRASISLLRRKQGGFDAFASTLPSDAQLQLADHFAGMLTKSAETSLVSLDGQRYVSAINLLSENASETIYSVIQRPLDEELAPYSKLTMYLVFYFAIGLLLAAIGGLLIARRISRPILQLADQARLIQQGSYPDRLDLHRHDEVGILGDAFNHMVKGLEQRDKVQNLLGKVVSPEIAAELMNKEIVLGGEEKQVTILFADLRNFTSLCEGRRAKDILSLLNEYLTRMSAIIEAHHGVIDKYIGDAIMAIYGTPLTLPRAEMAAIRSALQMERALIDINQDFSSRGLPSIDIGIGINTDIVVAGNMGSNSRLNYTVIGDGVNAASRIEGLTKIYGVKTLVSESTKLACPEQTFREIDIICVKGKTDPITIYQPFDPLLSPQLASAMEPYHRSLGLYRNREWQAALQSFETLAAQHPERLYSIYAERCRQLINRHPGDNWAPITVLDHK